MTLSTKYPLATRGKIIVWGMLASSPFGGMIWQVLHHLVGLRQLGFDVWYVEDSERLLYDPVTYWPTTEYAANVQSLSRFMESVGLGDRWVFRPPGVWDSVVGATDLAGLDRLYQEADAALNLCGAQELRNDHSSIRCLVHLETDPVEYQVAVANGDLGKIEKLDAHDYLFTYGTNLGAPDCLVPLERYRWHPTWPPVCIDWWANDSSPPSAEALTTIANWKHTDKDVVWQGKSWRWSKHHQFRRFINLPSRSTLPLELAVGKISDHDKGRLRNHGWRVVPSLVDFGGYRDYIRGSLGEFTVAKEQYVRPRSGWFSDRSVCYLAAGRPVIMQDTGFGNIIPTGEGLFSFATEDEALAAIDAVARNYARHSAAALEVAREFFDAERVLGEILRKVGLM